MQEMRCRVVPHRPLAARSINCYLHRIADLHREFRLYLVEGKRTERSLRIGDAGESLTLGVADGSLVTHLPAPLCIERCLGNDHLARCTSLNLVNGQPVNEERKHPHVRGEMLIANKPRLTMDAQEIFKSRRGCCVLRKCSLLAAAASLTLLEQRSVKSSAVHCDATLCSKFDRQVDWEAIGVVQLERGLSVKLRRVYREVVGALPDGSCSCRNERCDCRCEELRPSIKRACKLRLFAL